MLHLSLVTHQDITGVCVVALRPQVRVEGTNGNAMPWGHGDEGATGHLSSGVRRLYRIHDFSSRAEQLHIAVCGEGGGERAGKQLEIWWSEQQAARQQAATQEK